MRKSGKGAVVKHHGDPVDLLQVFDMVADSFPFISDDTRFTVGGIFSQIMGKNTLPIAFDSVMD